MQLVDKCSTEPFYQQIYRKIASDIEGGALAEGTRLPSIRACAKDLDVSVTTIEIAYRELVAEGYVEARQGSGHVVCRVRDSSGARLQRSEGYRQALERLHAHTHEPKRTWRFDFAYDAIDPSVFPLAAWARTSRDVFFGESSGRSFFYDDSQGLRQLRTEIAAHVNEELGLDWNPDQVLIMPTTRDLLNEILMLFDASSTVVGLENPGYDEAYAAFARMGFRTRAIPVYPTPTAQEYLQSVDGLDIVFATPSCQFPTNIVMPPDVRKALVKWANDTGAYIVADEYGWELSPGVGRVVPMAAIDDAGSVIMTGTFSNCFSPAVCLSYALLPPELMLKWRGRSARLHPRVPWQTQAAMAAFMREGQWNSHVRKMRQAVLKKRELLMESLHACMGDAVEIVMGRQFALVRTKDARGEAELIEAAEREDVRVYPTSRYWVGYPNPAWDYVLVGYAGLPADEIAPGVEALARAWGFAS
ncbi:PLP-dependent aminotransferase family protein [Denitrobacterium detoxificans]|jgi:GntR family transcriptional regulator/MocR family aminotransferase|uniref:MocR-like pyridoxine biosynthesis transcription factor PdxR n=1 Tax=Denitrobacterium detoxificans TaxID=79604 RepID=UPI0026F245CD|nr:PLP-dependent aminotransferase family protein [Denitrobacterium detoxificans]MBE6466665.1 PLP-dependent aminotransferase family protein [Denitrobacterium detoxificans]